MYFKKLNETSFYQKKKKKKRVIVQLMKFILPFQSIKGIFFKLIEKIYI